MTTALYILSIAADPSDPDISLHSSRAAAEAALQAYAQQKWARDKEPKVPKPATPAESADYLNGPANFIAFIVRARPDQGLGEGFSLSGEEAA